MRKTVLIALIFSFGLTRAMAQICPCHQVLDSLIKKTEADYAGYIHKVKEPGNALYNKLVRWLKARSENTAYADCYSILESYVDFFNDAHLFVTEFPKVTSAQSDSLRLLIKHFPITPNFTKTLVKKTGRDSAEGVWEDTFNQQIAIVKKGDNLFYGVIIQTKVPKWEPGMVRFELKKLKKNEYSITYYKDNFSKIHFPHLHIYKNVFLPFGLYRVTKIFPRNQEMNYLNPANPISPFIKVIDKNNVLVTVPSALIEEKELDSVLNKYDAVIKTTPNLIIDIRGNHGGNFIWGGLYDIANTIVHPINTKKSGEDDFLMLASEDDAEYIKGRLAVYYQNKKDSAGIKYYDYLIGKIRNNLGKIIGFSYYSSGADTVTRVVNKYPSHISIIIDKGDASAAEAFILGIKETSSKVTLYGTNTHGVIDYMNVNTVPFGGKGNPLYYLGYPVYFAKDIKKHPNNPTGIKPDIYIPTEIPDWIQWVANDFNRKARR